MSASRRLALQCLTLSAVAALPRAAAAQQCSPANQVEQPFPAQGGGPEQTRWRICFAAQKKYGLIISSAEFRTAPNAPWIKVLGDSRIAEIFVPYHSGSPRYEDVGTYQFPLAVLTEPECPRARGGTRLPDARPLVCKEVRDRGLAWKTTERVRRGEEVVLWGALKAGNYVYLQEWSFRDDGAIVSRLGATGQNLPDSPLEAHMHNGVWRLDVDLGGAGDDAVARGIHTELGEAAVDSEVPVAKEASLTWRGDAFEELHIYDTKLTNGRGSHIGYHLIPLRSGTARHQESWTQGDFWVTRNKPIPELRPQRLGEYTGTTEPVGGADIVVWYVGSAHHLVRDEDGRVLPDETWDGVTQVMWTGFMLKPHNLFDRAPLYGPAQPVTKAAGAARAGRGTVGGGRGR